jgi:hypothetical protein
MERDPATPVQSLNATGRIRRIWLDGEWHTDPEVTRVADAGPSHSGIVRRELVLLGFKFHDEPAYYERNGRMLAGKRFIITNPRHVPSEADAQRLMEFRQARRLNRKPAEEKRTRSRRRTTAPPPPAALEPVPTPTPEPAPERLPARFPKVDDDLTVYLAMREKDGSMLMGLRNGSESWIVTINAHSAESQ